MRTVRKYTPDEDAPLLAAWQRGDIFSFETLVWKYLKRVYNLSHLITGVPESAAEAVQNAFVSAYREIGSLRSTSRFSTWLAGLTIKESRKLLDFNELSRSADAPVAAIVEENSDLASALSSPPFQGDIRSYITALPPELGEVIVLRYVRGYSLERMEEILQIRTEVLASRLFDAQEILASQMKHGGGSAGTGMLFNRDDSLPHPEIRRTLPGYIDNAATEEEKNLIRKHLGGCGSCREALAELEWMVERLKSIPDMEPPQWLTAAIMTKIRSVGPLEPVLQSRSFSPLLFSFLLGVCIVTLLSISWYFLDGKGSIKTPEISRDEAAERKPLKLAPEGKAPQPLPTLPPDSTNFRINGKGAAPVAGTALPASPTAQPDSFSPSARSEVPASVQKPSAASAGLKPDTTVKKTRLEIPPQLPQDWGESLLSNRATPRKAAIQKSRSGEVAVLLGVDDPTGSVQEIEQAVTGLGGKITGRAYSSGHDILYTQIESDKFFELMKRLGKIGKILELPQIQDEEAGSIDLVIRW
jgi:RNA polymerase sigma-70 factor (ECF subfamily)